MQKLEKNIERAFLASFRNHNEALNRCRDNSFFLSRPFFTQSLFRFGLLLMIISYRPLDNLPLIAAHMRDDLETITRSIIAQHDGPKNLGPRRGTHDAFFGR